MITMHSQRMDALVQKLSAASPSEKVEILQEIFAERARLLAKAAADAEVAQPVLEQVIRLDIHDIMHRVGERFRPAERGAVREFLHYDRETGARVTITIKHDPDTMPCATHGKQVIVLIDPNAPERGMRCEVCLAESVAAEGSPR